jgi:ribosomal protein L18
MGNIAKKSKAKLQGRLRRHRRVRVKVNGQGARPRLAVFRSNKHIYAQVIDDLTGKTLVSVSSLSKDAADRIVADAKAAAEAAAKAPPPTASAEKPAQKEGQEKAPAPKGEKVQKGEKPPKAEKQPKGEKPAGKPEKGEKGPAQEGGEAVKKEKKKPDEAPKTVKGPAKQQPLNAVPKTSNRRGAMVIGKLLAERCKEKGISTVVFDRGGFKYHGRIKALAESARKNGLKF